MATAPKDAPHPNTSSEPHAASTSAPAAKPEVVLHEGLTRSREIEAVGVEAWKAKLDQRPEEDRPQIVKDYIAGGDVLMTKPGSGKQVPGVGPPPPATPAGSHSIPSGGR